MITLTPRSQPTLLAELPQPSSTYKRQVWLAVTGLLVFIALYFVLAGWFVWTAWRMTAGWETITPEGVFIAFCALFLAVMMLKGLFYVSHGGTEGSVEITEDDQPRLFAFLHALADAAEAPRPHRVFLAPNVNAAVFYDLSALNLIFPTKKNLEIGLGLVNALTLGELRAVLAHEFGHFTQSSMAVIRWSYLAQQIAAHLVARRDKLDGFLVRLSHWDVRIAWIGWMLSLIVWSIRSLVDSAFGVVVMLQRALSREMEFQADLVSVALSGSDALIHALHRLQAADDSWDRTLGVVAAQHADGKIPRDVFTLHTRVMERMGQILADPEYGQVPPVPEADPAAHRLFKPELAQPPKMWLSHPLNHDREDNAKRDYVHATIDDRPAWTLFENVDVIREQVSAAMIGPEAPDPVPIEDSVEKLDAQFDREFLRSDYRGMYLGRSVARSVPRAAMLVEPMNSWRQHLDGLYPETLVKDVARLRAFEKELGQLRAIHSGALAPAEGGIRHRGRIIKPGELPGAIERVEADAADVEKRLATTDKLCRSVHLAAARELGNGWPEYLEGLIAMLHYADHTASNIEDLHSVLGHTVHIATVTRRISSSGRKRVVAGAVQLHNALGAVFAQASHVALDETLAGRMGNTSWSEILGKFQLGAPDEDNIGDWLGVIDGWTSQASGPFSALRTEALEQLLITEAQIAGHVRAGTPPGAAPAPSRVPQKYETLVIGKERELEATLNWWERFQIADGKVAAVARVAVAAGIVAGVLGFGGTVGSSSITVYNGLSIPVVVDVAGEKVTVDPLGIHTLPVPKAGIYPIAAHTRAGTEIERFSGEIPGTFGKFVYNVGAATPLVEWTAIYGTTVPEPDRMLGAPRWAQTEARLLFVEPPDSVETKYGGAKRTMLSAISDAPPMSQVMMLEDSVQQLNLVQSHARWDATSSENILGWMRIAHRMSPHFGQLLAVRLAESPNDVVLLRMEQDAATGAAHDSVCVRHRALAEAAPDSGNLYYLGARCLADEAAKAQAFVAGHEYWTDNAWLAYAAAYTHLENARWAEAIPALELTRRTLRPVARQATVDLARVRRLVGSDTGRAMAALVRSSPDLAYAMSLETGKGLGTTPEAAYATLLAGDLEKALKVAGKDSAVAASVLRLAAASDGASEEVKARALALGTEAGLDNDTRWSTIAVALRTGQDHTPYLPSDESVSAEYVKQALRFIERARNGKYRLGAESELVGLPPLMRGHAYSMATIVLGDETPVAWRAAAKKLLFGGERPYFK